MKKVNKIESISSAPENGEDFVALCHKFRVAKIALDRMDDEVKRTGNLIKTYASEHGLRGDMNGVKLSRRLSFSAKESAESASDAGIEIPYSSSVTFDLPLGEVKEIVKNLDVKPTSVSASIDSKKLEKLMKEAEVEATYVETMAIGLSTVE